MRGTEGQVATISINQSINQEFYSDLSMAEAKGHQVLAEGARVGEGSPSRSVSPGSRPLEKLCIF